MILEQAIQELDRQGIPLHCRGRDGDLEEDAYYYPKRDNVDRFAVLCAKESPSDPGDFLLVLCDRDSDDPCEGFPMTMRDVVDGVCAERMRKWMGMPGDSA